MLLPLPRVPIRVFLVLLALSGLVQCQFRAPPSQAQSNQAGATKSTKQGTTGTVPVQHKILYKLSQLPPPVREMLDHIQMAIRSGRIEDLRTAIEWNELRPAFAAAAAQDPIAHFKAISGDGAGLEILAILANVLKSGYIAQPLGPDIENNLIYVWPYFAEIPLQELSAAQRVQMLRIMPVERYNEMMKQGKYSGYRLSIGADGTWHEFLKGP